LRTLLLSLAAICGLTVSTSAARGSTCGADVNGSGGVDMGDVLAIIGQWGPCPAPPALCPADIAPSGGVDGQVNINDLLSAIGAWGPCPVGACWLPKGSCQVMAESTCAAAGGMGWVLGATCIDTDTDRIPNAFELNDCSAPKAPFVGSNPTDADTDGDTLFDGDELFGTLSGIDLATMGCSPLRKNALIEVDWFNEAEGGSNHTHRPTTGAINLLVAVFNSSPVTNLCGGNGVGLIIDYGQGGAFTGGNLIAGGDTVVVWDSEFNAYKAVNFAPERNGIFYYSIHAHRYNTPTTGSTGVAELNGDDHMVTLMTSLSDSNISKIMMHEFGHNLGLHHGGFQSLNFKPNYNSVMNYRYTFPGVDVNCNGGGDGVLNYSIGANASLNENALIETNGICGGVDIDWNANAVIDAGPVARNIKCVSGVSVACGTSNTGCCQNDCNSTCQTLQDYNDWASIGFTGLNHPDDALPEILDCQPPMDGAGDRQ
jgi:hypothetical protein